MSKVPTNAQLLLHLHRLAERTSAPLPRPPPPPGIHPDEHADLHDPPIPAEIGDSASPSHESTIGSDDNEHEEDVSGTEAKVQGTIAKVRVGAVGVLRKVARKGALHGSDVAVEAPEPLKEEKEHKLMKKVLGKTEDNVESEACSFIPFLFYFILKIANICCYV